jgi:ATP-dependent Clp protease adaptor protein ClpS
MAVFCRYELGVCPMSDTPHEPAVALPRIKPREQPHTRRVPPYHVVLANDDHHSFEFVVGVLRKVLGCALERAEQLTHEAHTTGRAVIWTGPREVAELKAEQVTTFHEVRQRDSVDLGPLSTTIEPAPGA